VAIRQPDTRYAKGPGGDVAYQVVGDAPMNLVVVPGWFSHVDMLWGPSVTRTLLRMAHRR
jgi:hypothetical protein